jgi:hypothetical protein
MLLLAIIGGAAAAVFVTIFGFAGVGGILWIFVFGDDPWPGWVYTVLDTAIPIVGLLLWAWFSRSIWLRLSRLH